MVVVEKLRQLAPKAKKWTLTFLASGLMVYLCFHLSVQLILPIRLFQAPTFSLLEYEALPDLDYMIQDNGTAIAYQLLKTKGTSRGLVIVHHSNAETLLEVQLDAMKFNHMGFDVLVYDYPGYGKSTGYASEESFYEVGLSLFRFAVNQKKYAPENIVLFGRSIGSAVATYIAKFYPVKALLLEAPFTSPPRIITHNYPITAPFLNNLAHISETTAPIMIAHGELDSTINVSHSKKIAQTYADKVFCFKIYPGIHHNQIKYEAKNEYWHQIKAFLDFADFF